MSLHNTENVCPSGTCHSSKLLSSSEVSSRLISRGHTDSLFSVEVSVSQRSFTSLSPCPSHIIFHHCWNYLRTVPIISPTSVPQFPTHFWQCCDCNTCQSGTKPVWWGSDGDHMLVRVEHLPTMFGQFLQRGSNCTFVDFQSRCIYTGHFRPHLQTQNSLHDWFLRHHKEK